MSPRRACIVLVRHGQTAWNRQPQGRVRFRGQADVTLNDFGRKQAAATARYLARRWPVEAVYASPLARAMETARAIAEAHEIPARSLEGLLDINFGNWEGHTPDEARRQYPDLLTAWFEAPHTVEIPGGESLEVVRARAVAGLTTIVERHQGQTVAMVGHTVVNRVLLCAVLGLGNKHFWRLRQDTCGVNVFEVDEEGSAIIVVLNDTSHLQDI